MNGMVAGARKRVNRIHRREIAAGYLFLLPSALGFFVFIGYPILYGFYLSFTNGDGFNTPDWIGLTNYARMLKDPLVMRSLMNNVKYALTYVPGIIALSLLVSVLIYNGIKGAKFFKTVLFFPYITSSIAISTIWKQMMQPDKGMINNFLRALGVANPPSWFAATNTALYSVVIVAIWAGFGFNMVIFLAGLQGIPRELYEAGELDGTNRWQAFAHITFPMLSPTIFFLTCMSVISSFKVFDFIFQLTQGGPGNATTVLVYRIYYEGIVNMRFGYASAIAYLLFVLILALTLLQFYLQKKWVYYSED